MTPRGYYGGVVPDAHRMTHSDMLEMQLRSDLSQDAFLFCVKIRQSQHQSFDYGCNEYEQIMSHQSSTTRRGSSGSPSNSSMFATLPPRVVLEDAAQAPLRRRSAHICGSQARSSGEPRSLSARAATWFGRDCCRSTFRPSPPSGSPAPTRGG